MKSKKKLKKRTTKKKRIFSNHSKRKKERNSYFLEKVKGLSKNFRPLLKVALVIVFVLLILSYFWPEKDFFDKCPQYEIYIFFFNLIGVINSFFK